MAPWRGRTREDKDERRHGGTGTLTLLHGARAVVVGVAATCGARLSCGEAMIMVVVVVVVVAAGPEGACSWNHPPDVTSVLSRT